MSVTDTLTLSLGPELAKTNVLMSLGLRARHSSIWGQLPCAGLQVWGCPRCGGAGRFLSSCQPL